MVHPIIIIRLILSNLIKYLQLIKNMLAYNLLTVRVFIKKTTLEFTYLDCHRYESLPLQSLSTQSNSCSCFATLPFNEYYLANVGLGEVLSGYVLIVRLITVYIVLECLLLRVKCVYVLLLSAIIICFLLKFNV